MRALLLALLLAPAGCTTPEPPATAEAPGEPTPQTPAVPDDREWRGTQAGLAPAQSAQMAGYAFGAVVPRLAPGWRLASYRDETVAEAVVYPGYSLQYVHDDGRCFDIMAASEGLGDVFVIEPPNLVEADAPHISLYGPIPVGWSGPDEAGDWGPDRLSTEWFGTDALFFKLSSATEDGCAVVSANDATAILESLHYLDPADDAAPAGHWELQDVSGVAIDPTDPTADPEAHALSTFGAAEGEGTRSTVRTVRSGPHMKLVLVTSEGLADDSVRDQRVRVAYVRDFDGAWVPQYAGRQQRCREGRGQTDWGVAACV